VLEWALLEPTTCIVSIVLLAQGAGVLPLLDDADEMRRRAA